MIVGAEYIIFITLIFLIYLIAKGDKLDKRVVVNSLISILIAYLLIQFIRLFWLEPRPFISNHITPLIKLDPDASFPSVHTSIMSSIAFSFVFFKSKYQTLLLLFMIWVGFARIFVGVHYPLDILAGIGVGLITAISTKQILLWTKTKLV